MLTEEKLQNFLDDLRLGKYDDERYEVTAYCGNITVKDLNNNVETSIGAYPKSVGFFEAEAIWQKRCKLWKWLFKKPDYNDYPLEYYAYVDFPDNACQISESLYKSFDTYRIELKEKDKLVRRSNIESTFGL